MTSKAQATGNDQSAGMTAGSTRPDFIAGLTAAAVVLPKGMAYATVAGLPVSVGLYTAFVPMIDVAHQGYNNIWPPKHPDWMSNSYLENKRNNARILKDNGMTNYRMYEVRSVSHSGGEGQTDDRRSTEYQTIDLSKAMDKFIDMYEAQLPGRASPLS